jgi:integrase
VLPLTGKLWEIVQGRARERRLECPFVFHRKGRPVKDFREAWYKACVASGLGRVEKLSNGKEKYTGTIPHDLRRCTARNLSRAGVPESVAMEITGHKTRSMYRRYRIVDEKDLREATERLEAHLDQQSKSSVVTPMKAAS